MTKYSDKKLLDWLENNSGGYILISDDDGHWACTNSGMQSVNTEKDDVEATFFIMKDEWKDTVREAIIAAIEEERSNHRSN